MAGRRSGYGAACILGPCQRRSQARPAVAPETAWSPTRSASSTSAGCRSPTTHASWSRAHGRRRRRSGLPRSCPAFPRGRCSSCAQEPARSVCWPWPRATDISCLSNASPSRRRTPPPMRWAPGSRTGSRSERATYGRPCSATNASRSCSRTRPGYAAMRSRASPMTRRRRSTAAPKGSTSRRECLAVIEAHLAPGGAALLQLGTEEQCAAVEELTAGRLEPGDRRVYPGQGVLLRLDRSSH